ncbi:NADH-quinone oxidoreductase subunit N [Desulfitispora alkaliphila]|uniref:NADH-quinone oxidoreductase subunit N n=1 Tax=Desulfitispora alkaliphila TaxID=622674 RepID=UPI003D235F7A
MNMDWSLISVEIITAGFGILLLLIGMVTPRSQRKSIGNLTGLVFIGLLALTISMANVNDTFMGMYTIDPYATFFKAIFLLSGILVIFASNEWIQKRGEYQIEFYTLITFATLGMMVLASASDLITTYVGVELMTISFIILTAFSKENAKSAEAGLKYLILGAVSSAILLYGLTLVYGIVGSVYFTDITAAVAQGIEPAMLLAIIFVIVGFAFKLAIVPFHMWSPDVYEGAPSLITALLSVASKAAAFAIFVRLMVVGFEGTLDAWVVLLIVLAVLTLILGNLVAIPQTNIKRLMAYSGIGHAGYIILGLIAYSELGITAVLFYSFIYVFTNLGAFIVIVAYENATGSTEIKDYAGLSTRAPLLSTVMLVCLLSLAGLPPLSGFIGKFFLFTAVIEQGYIWLAMLALGMSLVSVYYYLMIVKVMYLGEPKSDEPIAISSGMKFGLMVCLVVTVVLGVYPTPILELAALAAQAFMPF